MPKDYTPPPEAADTYTRYKAHYEGERKLKPEMLEAADRDLKAGATVGQLAAWTGLTPEVFRRRARALGVERKRPPTVGKLAPQAAMDAMGEALIEAATAAVQGATPGLAAMIDGFRRPTTDEQGAQAAPAPKPRRRPEPKEGRPLTDDEAKTLAELAYSRASGTQAQKLKQNAAQVGDGYKDLTVVSSAMGMGLLTHDEVYAPAEPVEPTTADEEPTP
jgi:hypothetical protein